MSGGIPSSRPSHSSSRYIGGRRYRFIVDVEDKQAMNDCRDHRKPFYDPIILEDDCVPSTSFFPYCADLLDRYESDERAMMISGNNHLLGHAVTADSYYFSRHRCGPEGRDDPLRPGRR
jgi:hypothetical protein